MAQFRSIDSIELVFRIDTQQDMYHRVIIEENRGVPIRYSTLQPHSRQELQAFVNTEYQVTLKKIYLVLGEMLPISQSNDVVDWCKTREMLKDDSNLVPTPREIEYLMYKFHQSTISLLWVRIEMI